MYSEWIDDDSLNEAEEIEAGLSAVLSGATEDSSPEEIEQWIDESVSQFSPVESLDFGKALQSLGKAVGSQSGVRQFVGQALPLVGTAVGTVYGGPVGAAIGSQVGQVAGQALGGKQSKTGEPVGGSTAQTPPTPPPEPDAGSNKAAAGLLHVVQNPAFLTSLLSLAMGSHGRSSVPVGGKEVPVAAFMNLVSMLAGKAAQGSQTAAQSEEEGAIPPYLTDAEGNLLVDSVDPVQRADALLKLLEEETENELSDHESSTDYEDWEDLEDEVWATDWD